MSSDPLQALGSSLFLQVIHHLDFPSVLALEAVAQPYRELIRTYERTIWHRQCLLEDVEAKHMTSLEALAAASPPNEDPDEPTPPNAESPVKWREVCKAHVSTDRNWRWGRARESWVTPDNNTVWRIKVDHEQGTVLSTSRPASGLLVSDLATSQPLFKIREVRPWAHLEFAKGFAIFDVGQENDEFGLQVYRTQNAIDRSTRPTPPPNRRPQLAHTAVSLADPGWRCRSATGPLPRGHLAFYRSIVPPTACIAFRARVDHEGTPDGRAVLATAGEEAIYLWDLEDPDRKEVIPIAADERARIQYIEFDEDYVFLCGQSRMHIYSRRTKARVMTFPDSQEVHSFPALGFALDPVTGLTLNTRRSAGIDDKLPAPVGTADLEGLKRGEEGWEGLLDAAGPGIAQSLGPDTVMDFSACHYTPTDLICTANCGAIVIVRDYRDVFGASEPRERQQRLQEQTIWLSVGERVRHLSTHLTRVAFATSTRLYFFDTSTLPPLPLDPQAVIAPFRIHAMLSTLPNGVRMSSCVQMDRSHIYLTYWALAEMEPDQEGVIDADTGERRVPPDRALGGFGCCVKVWDMSA